MRLEESSAGRNRRLRFLSRATIFACLCLASLSALAQERIRDVIYLKQGGCAFTFDVFKPANPNHKAIVWIVSGGWFSNHEGINPDLAKPMNDAGFTVFEIVHGSQPKFQVPEIVKQLQHALRFIHANAGTYGIDPNAIGVTGMSAGGHLSLMLGALEDNGDPNAKDPVDKESDKVGAVVAFMPPTDMLNWGADGVVPWKIPVMAVFMPAYGITKDTPEDTLVKLGREWSPIYHIGPGFPPTLIVHGDKDGLVPPQQAHKMDEALDAAKLEHKLLMVPGGGHDGKTLQGGFQQMLEWFGSHLKAG
ncbi:MAG TPA: alpha/beta hydrolase [Fimbriimonadaceae bacterium]|nr:alpha/beta hydrolase [Fimbriimonadaceae bacterium]